MPIPGTKVIIKSVLKTPKPGDEIDFPVNCALDFGPDSITVYELVEPQVPTAGYLKREISADDQEFIKKWQIRPGQHLVNFEEGMVEIPVKEEKYFETKTANSIMTYLNSFYSKLDVLKKYKKTKRSYLLHSDPGMGKSALIRHVCRQALKREGAAIIHTPGSINFEILTHMFMKDYHQDVKFIVLIIEDLGNRNYTENSAFYNSSCLNFLDGQESLFRVPTLIIATTNFAKELGPQFTNRPGRFNKIIRVQLPSDQEVCELIEGFGDRILTDHEKTVLAGKGLTPDHCIEAILRAEIEEVSLEQSVNEILQERVGLDWNKT